ncbi:MAG TPA: hypothetical protein VJ948_03200 [Acidimicrobiia bacterium]|nr:hypothetical protein [Acidimicrobiia bacterium]
MPRLGWLLAVLLMTPTACGQVEPVLVAVSMPDCAHQGATSMEEGEARLILTLNGLADVGLALVEITGDRDYQDLVEHLTTAPRWDRPPPWVTEVASLRIDGGIGVDSVEETLDLEEGLYAVVCLDHSSEEAGSLGQPAAPLLVRAG